MDIFCCDWGLHFWIIDVIVNWYIYYLNPYTDFINLWIIAVSSWKPDLFYVSRYEKRDTEKWVSESAIVRNNSRCNGGCLVVGSDCELFMGIFSTACTIFKQSFCDTLQCHVINLLNDSISATNEKNLSIKNWF